MKVPHDIDEPFVLNQFNAPEEESFAFVMSTLRLLRNAACRKNITADGTYKIMWQGFPLVGVGFLDRTGRFHLIGLCVTARERATEYNFVFKSVKKAIFKHAKTAFEPDVLISDAAPAIRNAFFEVFGDEKQNVICYIHVQRNISKYAHYRSKSNKNLIMNDFTQIQSAANESVFDKAIDLFIEKWTQAEPEFCEYFRKEWCQTNTKNWYNGYSPFVPAHNNAHEGYNLHIKRDHTLRERSPFDTFKVAMKAMLRDMSKRYDPLNMTGEVKKIRNLPEITNQMFEAAHKWYTDSRTIIGEISDDDTTIRRFIVPSSHYFNRSSAPSLDELEAIQNEHFDTFDDFISNGYAMQYNVHVKNDQTTCFTESTCMCKSFHRSFICKHIIGLSFHLKLKKVPKLADSNIIHKKQPRGRAAKAKKALTKQ